MKRILAIAFSLGTVAVGSLFTTPAKAVDANVNIKVSVPDILFLETYSDLTFDVDVDDLITNATPDVIQAVSGNVDLGTSVVDTLLGTGTLPSFKTQPISVNDVEVYRVWGLGSTDGNISHNATYDDTDLAVTGSTTGSIVAVTATGPNATDPAPGLDYADAIKGNVDFTLDFTNTTQSGLHEGGILTVTATAE
ncbi:hypothetical protein BLD44_009615 [Mastigocladus laminosus UU774]|nr:hypothetical protein B4U84_20785 [Westiellopsis prolifica IICB1]TFI54517.1 hypothetical protein BLD44_009615 [Mastigocladus laminosus UU774]